MKFDIVFPMGYFAIYGQELRAWGCKITRFSHTIESAYWQVGTRSCRGGPIKDKQESSFDGHY